jgi:peroxiredoxin
METYRDQYVKVFNGGKGVTVLAISTDADTVQANWAHDAHFPVTFVSDPDGVAGKLYDVMYPLTATLRIPIEKRIVYVIGKDGVISHVMSPFKEMVDDSYTELSSAVAEAIKAAGGKP